MKKTKYFIAISLLIITQSFGQELSGKAGSFVDIGFGTRAVGMGKAYVALANDASSIFWNPAGLSNAKNIGIEFNYSKQLQIIPYGTASASIPLGNNNGIGLGIIYSGDDALKENTFMLAYGHQFGDLSAGLSFKYRYASFGNNGFNEDDYIIFDPDEIEEGRLNQVFGNGNGFGLDLGLQYHLHDYITLGLVVKDVFAPVNWSSDNKSTENKPKGSYNESIPMELVFGVSLNPTTGVIINTDYKPSILPGTSQKFNFGAEYLLFDIVAFRAGTQQFLNSEPDEKYTVGLGIQYKITTVLTKVNFTYLIEDLSNTYRFSVGIDF
ncbi:MAG: PorV/PorQ family protein [Bacteroidetes bacterium]|nr:PorV/PorQ family protein [Bacteroidota bacterium]MBU1116622.1 PorV/PorQ family protein [Bacteroidota bacterium]MBU1797739.1 PorV/PorQ family protein [Bacteroidota bacterium]